MQNQIELRLSSLAVESNVNRCLLFGHIFNPVQSDDLILGELIDSLMNDTINDDQLNQRRCQVCQILLIN